MSRWRIGTLLGVLATAVALAGCGTGNEPAESPSPDAFANLDPAVEYVGSEACADCHADLWASYQSHGMAQSLYALTPERAVEDFDGVEVVDPNSGLRYTAYARDGRFFQEEYLLDDRGERVHRLVREMEVVVGSGSAARTYLDEENGRYYELPLTWYTQAEGGEGRWDFSPGYRERNDRFSRTVPARCMACHTGVANDGVTEPVALADGKFDGIAHGIGCERCHGPGALHVEARLEDPEPADSVDYTIVNPAHLPLDLRLDVCQQCHLNATVSLLREGSGPYSYRPGEPLAAHVALFNADGDVDDGRIAVISHADRMRQSACFIESGTMDCVTCHNPHEGFRDAGAAYFNATCQGCHAPAALQATVPTTLQEQHTDGADCYSCHMPRVEADDAPHASFTDHFIRVVRPEERTVRAAAVEEPGELAPYFERDRGGAEAAVYAAMAEVVRGRQEGDRDVLARGAQRLATALGEAPGIGEGHFLLGWARLQVGHAAEAVGPLERSLADGRIPERLNALAQAFEATGRAAEAEPLYREALSLQPALADVRVNYGRLLEKRGRLPEAVQQYRAAVQEEPWLVEAQYNLGTALLRQGDAAAAEAPLAEAVRLDPFHADALLNLGVLRAQQGDGEAAGQLFERAATAAPDDPAVQANLGTFRLQQNDLAGATEAFRRALAADPARPDANAGLAAALLQQSDVAGARRHAEIALRADPSQPLARQVLTALG